VVPLMPERHLVYSLQDMAHHFVCSMQCMT